MIPRNVILKAEAVEQRFLHHRPLAHHLLSPAARKTESDQHDNFNEEFFNAIRPNQSFQPAAAAPKAVIIKHDAPKYPRSDFLGGDGDAQSTGGSFTHRARAAQP
jgi:hypothetical protein